ncbi:hypothetical protein [Olleya marilimosa]|uniref:hypothetical protein n=1 Tax=Olleya marilimosa TaxID=272164 RepID=UPI0004AC9A98|nr:hypothetical protein [Olleya marilimosa]
MKFSNKIQLVLILLFSLVTSLQAQDKLNNYKYVVVANQFDFQSEPDQYRLNGLTKFLLEKQNFTVFSNTDVLPDDAINNGCLVLYATLKNSSSLFKTKINVQFENCKKEIVFTSDIGESRDKKYIVAYNEATRNAFNTFSSFIHTYKPTAADNQTTEVTALKQEIETLKAEQSNKDNIKAEATIKNEVVKVTDTPVKETTKTETKTETIKPADNALHAKLISGSVFSYNLLDANGKVVYTILFSGKEDYYIVKGQDALIYKMNNQWVLAHYVDNDLQIKAMTINF